MERAAKTTSIAQMIDRFRKSEPTSRGERATRREKGMLRELWFEGSSSGGRDGTAGNRRGFSKTLAVTPQRAARNTRRSRYGDENAPSGSGGYERDERDGYVRRENNGDRGRDRDRDRDRDRRRDSRDNRNNSRGRDYRRAPDKSRRSRAERTLRTSQSRASGDALPVELLTESGYEMGRSVYRSGNFGRGSGMGMNMSTSYGSMGRMGNSMGRMNMGMNDMMGRGINNPGNTGLSVDNLIEGDLIQSLGGMPGNNTIDDRSTVGVSDTSSSSSSSSSSTSASPDPNATANLAGSMSGLMPTAPLPANASLVALDLENALMPFKKLYMRKEQKRQEDRSRAVAELKASLHTNPLEEDIRAITAIEAAAAGVPMLAAGDMRPGGPVFVRRTDRPRGLAHSVDFSGAGLGGGTFAHVHPSSQMLSPSSGHYRRGIDALDLEIAAAQQQVTAGYGTAYGGAGSPGSFYPFDAQQGIGSFDPEDINIPPPPPETPMELRGNQKPAQAASSASGMERAAEAGDSASSSQDAAGDADAAGDNVAADNTAVDIQAQLDSLEKTVREKTGKIEKSIAEANSVLGPVEPVLEIKPGLDLPSSLSDAADHISERLDIAMFSISRRLHSQSRPADDTMAVGTAVPDFLTQESDTELQNITLTAMQAEREAIMSMQQDVARRTAMSAFGAAGVLNNEASGFGELARASMHRQNMRSIEAQRHRVAAGAAEAEVAAADEELMRMSIEKQQRQAELSAQALGLGAMLDGTGTGLDFTGPMFLEPGEPHPLLRPMVDPAVSIDGGVAARSDASADAAAQGEEEKSSATKDAAEKDDEISAEDTIPGRNDAMAPAQNGSVAQARNLFNAASAASKDGCITGADAEDILHKLGATSIDGMPMGSALASIPPTQRVPFSQLLRLTAERLEQQPTAAGLSASTPYIAPPASFMAPLDHYTAMMTMPTMPMAPPFDPVSRMAATPMVLPPSNSYPNPPAPPRGPSPESRPYEMNDPLRRSVGGNSSYGSSFDDRASAESFGAQQFSRGNFPNEFNARRGRMDREIEGGSSKQSDTRDLYAEKMADKSASLSTLAGRQKRGEGKEKSSVGGGPLEQKVKEFSSEGSQKIDSANEELMRFRKLRQSLREGVY